MSGNTEICTPNPAATIESIRSLGYDLNIAIADLIDNSISADAENIWILHKWDGNNSFIAIYDDGIGMNESKLFKAMSIGSMSPTIERDKNDLGRFGLGLKVASWSQCRQLTVTTKGKNKKIYQRKWDIDFVSSKNEWLLMKDTDKDSNRIINRLLTNNNNGTVVLWQDLDRLINIEKDEDDVSEQHFYKKIEILKKYLSMIFHRYISGPKSCKIFVSNIDQYGKKSNRLKPWDPFLEKNSNTIDMGTEKKKYKKNSITITPFVLPHHSKYVNNAKFQDAGGINGWNAHQGFFVYRQRRLIMHGGWMGFFKPEDHYKLARIRVDIPNNMDTDWKIGVKKVEVTPPDVFKKTLKHYAEIVRERAAKVYRYRGKIDKRGSPDIKELVWKRYKTRSGVVTYKIEKKHPLIESTINAIGNNKNVNRLLKLVEKTVPVETIIVSDRDNPNAHLTDQSKSDSDKIPLKIWYDEHMEMLTKKLKMSRSKAFEKLLTIEPFNLYISELEVYRGTEDES